MNEEAYLNLLSRYVSNELSLEETEVLLEWIGNDPKRESLLRDFQETWELTSSFPKNFNVDVPASWTKIQHSLNDFASPNPTKNFSIRRWIGLIIAVLSIVLILLAAFVYYCLIPGLS